jgi:hypothetical protein
MIDRTAHPPARVLMAILAAGAVAAALPARAHVASAFSRPSTLGTALSLSKGRKTTNQQPAGFADARAAAAALPRLQSLIVSIRGETVVEYYAKGAAAGRATNVKSASKSVISTLVGIAIDRVLL